MTTALSSFLLSSNYNKMKINDDGVISCFCSLQFARNVENANNGNFIKTVVMSVKTTAYGFVSVLFCFFS